MNGRPKKKNAKMPQLLIELFSEEIPARMQIGAARDFKRLFEAKLASDGLSADSVTTYVGPRRLVLVAEGLPLEQASVIEDLKGPREGAPPAALEGFLRKTGLKADQLIIEDGVYRARIEKPGRKTKDALAPILDDIIKNFPWPKSMRSGTSNFRWVRPLKAIGFVFDGAVVAYELEGITASNVTFGHRFLGAGKPISYTDFASYRAGLEADFVVLDHADRQDIIWKSAQSACQAEGLEPYPDQGLLEEVAGLNEYPTALLGVMDEAFLKLPPEVIKTSMRTHQKYFAVRDSKTGKMAPRFVIVSNMKAKDGGAEIKRGNAKVLSARLSDGVFFWNEDQKAGNFDRWNAKLSGVTFHAKLGTMAERVGRITYLAKALSAHFSVDSNRAEQAASLSKADLASYMVGEFPELQGVMGGYYADAACYSKDIADAVRDHYRPQGPSDALPSTALGAVVALADKIDTLVGFFAINEKPTGSKDPFALRRAALGVLRIIKAFDVNIGIKDLVGHWYQSLLIYAREGRGVYLDTENWRGSAGPRWKEGETDVYKNYLSEFRQGLLQSPVWVIDTDRDYDLDLLYEHVTLEPKCDNAVFSFRAYSTVAEEFSDFVMNRLKVMLKDTGLDWEGDAGTSLNDAVINAALNVADDDLSRALLRVKAVATYVASGQEDVQAAYKRAQNILAAELKKGTVTAGDATRLEGAPDVETTLIDATLLAEKLVEDALKTDNFVAALSAYGALRAPVDAFLDGVLVNAEDASVRENRLKLLRGVTALGQSIIDIDKLL